MLVLVFANLCCYCQWHWGLREDSKKALKTPEIQREDPWLNILFSPLFTHFSQPSIVVSSVLFLVLAFVATTVLSAPLHFSCCSWVPAVYFSSSLIYTSSISQVQIFPPPPPSHHHHHQAATRKPSQSESINQYHHHSVRVTPTPPISRLSSLPSSRTIPTGITTRSCCTHLQTRRSPLPSQQPPTCLHFLALPQRSSRADKARFPLHTIASPFPRVPFAACTQQPRLVLSHLKPLSHL